MTNREIIDLFREMLKQRNADSNYSNQFLYNSIMKQAEWLIPRELSKGKLYSNTELFTTLRCIKVIETSLIDPCCPIKTNCTIYRTKDKVPDVWIDDSGPMVRDVTSVDFSNSFFLTTPTTWQNKREDPYQKKTKQNYTFYANGYFWFPEVNPHLVNLVGFWKEDVSGIGECAGDDCIRFLDSKFPFPEWLSAEMLAKATQLLVGVTERLPNDEQIDKNTTRKN